jgi:hypothetical protein
VIRFNNPGNLRPGTIKWLGEGPPQDGYCTFVSPFYGLRALGKLLCAYQSMHGLTTIRGMIDRFAPPADHNPTDQYVANVCAWCGGVDADADYPLTNESLVMLMKAIIRQENGVDALATYSDVLLESAAGSALRGNLASE